MLRDGSFLRDQKFLKRTRQLRRDWLSADISYLNAASRSFQTVRQPTAGAASQLRDGTGGMAQIEEVTVRESCGAALLPESG